MYCCSYYWTNMYAQVFWRKWVAGLLWCLVLQNTHTLAQLYINRELPHPSTSPTYCLDPRVCISAGDRALWPYNTASFICLNPECFGLRAEPWLCHGNLWTWSWTLPKTIDHIQTNMIPPLFPSLSFCFPCASPYKYLLHYGHKRCRIWTILDKNTINPFCIECHHWTANSAKNTVLYDTEWGLLYVSQNKQLESQ